MKSINQPINQFIIKLQQKEHHVTQQTGQTSLEITRNKPINQSIKHHVAKQTRQTSLEIT